MSTTGGQTNKYEIVKEVLKEFKTEKYSAYTLSEFLEEKTKDQLFEKYKKWWDKTNHFYVDIPENNASYLKFKEIFKDELNGTKGLHEAIENFKTKGPMFAISCREINYKLAEIKARLES